MLAPFILTVTSQIFQVKLAYASLTEPRIMAAAETYLNV